jgi:hypothetical protein
MTYSELQKICKDNNLKANVTKEEMKNIVKLIKNKKKVPEHYYLKKVNSSDNVLKIKKEKKQSKNESLKKPKEKLR